jgi:hypothetical protein
MVMELIPLMVGIAVAIIVAIALFSVFPSIVGSFACPEITSYMVGNVTITPGFVLDPSSPDSTAEQQWKISCENLQTQTTIVPILLSLAIVISAIIIVTRMFGG